MEPFFWVRNLRKKSAPWMQGMGNTITEQPIQHPWVIHGLSGKGSWLYQNDKNIPSASSCSCEKTGRHTKSCTLRDFPCLLRYEANTMPHPDQCLLMYEYAAHGVVGLYLLISWPIAMECSSAVILNLRYAKTSYGTSWTVILLWSSHSRRFFAELRCRHARNKLNHLINRSEPH
jgi:hypothetical protein